MDSTFETPISNFRRLIDQDLSERFQFIIKSSKKDISFKISKNEARAISKNVNDQCMIDPTIDYYELVIPNKSENQSDESYQDIFNLIIRSMREKVTISNDKQKEFLMIQFLLGEKLSTFEYKIQNINEAISFLNTAAETNGIDYLSEHFIELLESGEMRNLSEEIILTIIDNYTNRKSANDENFEKIFSLLTKQEEETSIIIHFILSNEIEYNSEVIDYIIQNLNDDIVSNELPLIKRFLINIFKKKKQFENKKITECKFEGNELSGIISYLKQKLGDSFKSSEALKLSGGGYPSPSYPITNLIGYDSKTINQYYYNSSSQNPESESDSWIEFDFGKRKINMTSYTIRTDNDGPNSYYSPKSWRIVGSNDHQNWNVINRQVNRSELNGNYKQHRFECAKSNNYYRYIRYIQEDSWNSSYSKYIFSLTCFEIFGSFLE